MKSHGDINVRVRTWAIEGFTRPLKSRVNVMTLFFEYGIS